MWPEPSFSVSSTYVDLNLPANNQPSARYELFIQRPGEQSFAFFGSYDGKCQTCSIALSSVTCENEMSSFINESVLHWSQVSYVFCSFPIVQRLPVSRCREWLRYSLIRHISSLYDQLWMVYHHQTVIRLLSLPVSIWSTIVVVDLKCSQTAYSYYMLYISCYVSIDSSFSLCILHSQVVELNPQPHPQSCLLQVCSLTCRSSLCLQ